MVQIPQRVRKPLLGRLDRVETLDEHFVEIQTASGAIATSVVHALKLILARLRGPVPSRRRVTLRWRRLSSRALLITRSAVSHIRTRGYMPIADVKAARFTTR
jgi:hypothetical protein